MGLLQKLIVAGSGRKSNLLAQEVMLVNPDGTPFEGGSGGSSITSASATTLEPDQEATATINGTTLELGIPKGEKGDQGEAGADGQNGEDGADGADGAAATIEVGTVTSGETASVTNSGSTSAAVLDFVLPKGDKGDTGEQGPQGDPGEDGAAGAAGEPGADGEDGVGVASITLTVTDGAVTAGTWEDTNGDSHTITIN